MAAPDAQANLPIMSNATLFLLVDRSSTGELVIHRVDNADGNRAAYNLVVTFDGNLNIVQKSNGWKYQLTYTAAQLEAIAFKGRYLNTFDVIKPHDVLAQEEFRDHAGQEFGAYGAFIEIRILDNRPEMTMTHSTLVGNQPDVVSTFPLATMHSFFEEIRVEFLNCARIVN